VLTASAYRPLVVQCQPSITEVSEQLSQFSVINGRPCRAAEFGRFCRGISRAGPRNLAKIFRGKLGPGQENEYYLLDADDCAFLKQKIAFQRSVACYPCEDCCVKQLL